MSEDELDDEYDDFEDDSIFDDDDDEDSYDDEEDDLYDDDDDLEDEYEEEASDKTYCFVCSLDEGEVPEDERWKFAVAGEDGSRREFWTCKSCRNKFVSLEDFDKFRSSWMLSRIYQVSSMLQRAVLWEAHGEAHEKAISELAFFIAGALFNEESMKTHATEELKKLKDRVIPGNGERP